MANEYSLVFYCYRCRYHKKKEYFQQHIQIQYRGENSPSIKLSGKIYRVSVGCVFFISKSHRNASSSIHSAVASARQYSDLRRVNRNDISYKLLVAVYRSDTPLLKYFPPLPILNVIFCFLDFNRVLPSFSASGRRVIQMHLGP